jgi:hypothetical protein
MPDPVLAIRLQLDQQGRVGGQRRPSAQGDGSDQKYPGDTHVDAIA